MSWMLGIAAIIVGADAASKLNVDHPQPVAWFEAVITVILVIATIVVYLREGEEV